MDFSNFLAGLQAGGAPGAGWNGSGLSTFGQSTGPVIETDPNSNPVPFPGTSWGAPAGATGGASGATDPNAGAPMPPPRPPNMNDVGMGGGMMPAMGSGGTGPNMPGASATSPGAMPALPPVSPTAGAMTAQQRQGWGDVSKLGMGLLAGQSPGMAAASLASPTMGAQSGMQPGMRQRPMGLLGQRVTQ